MASTSQNDYSRLRAERIVDTAALLQRRISERFPESGLSKLAGEIVQVAKDTVKRAHKIKNPILWLRFIVYVLIAIMVLLVVFGLGGSVLKHFNLGNDPVNQVQNLEALTSLMIVIGGGLYYLVSLEGRLKRNRALKAIHELRSLAHVVDMHQLAKTPDYYMKSAKRTRSSPQLRFTAFELSRYLDYCTEMLSLIGKIVVLYVEDFPDPVALDAVDQVENLTTGLSRKIWQKLSLLNMISHNETEGAEPGKPGYIPAPHTPMPFA